MRIPTITATLLALALAALDAPAQAGARTPSGTVPTARNLADWVAFIRPSAKELAYEQIGWRTAFWPAVAEARRLGRPILLWTMNGHPLGCT